MEPADAPVYGAHRDQLGYAGLARERWWLTARRRLWGTGSRRRHPSSPAGSLASSPHCWALDREGLESAV